MGFIDYFRILKALIILFLSYICMNYVPNQNGKVQEETLADSNSEVVKTTLRLYVISKWPFFFFIFFKNLSSFLCHVVTCNREYCEWLCRFRCHIQVGRLPVQGTWLGLVTLFLIWGSMWPRRPFPSGPSVALPHPSSCSVYSPKNGSIVVKWVHVLLL